MKVKDHKGNEFDSKSQMYRHYGINANVFNLRIHRGWSFKDALETPVGGLGGAITSTDHLGNTFSSVMEMCRHYGLSYQTFHERIRSGWTMKDALETPVGQKKSRKSRGRNKWLFGHK